jgi:hypothetical protein
MDASASIRSSYKPGQSVQFLGTKPAAHEALQKLVNNCLEGLRIYQPYQGEKANTILAKNPFFALVHQNPIESGFLVFSPRHAPVFLHESGRRSWIIRMRLSSKMHANTAIFAASLDKGDGYLWLEDVLVWEGGNIHQRQTFTERRKILKSFLEHHWMPDARCAGGLQIRIANYKSLAELKDYSDETLWWAIDFCPEAGDRRRFRLKAAGGKFSSLVAEIKAVSGLPDVYELWSAEDVCVGRAAIQELALSKSIREAVAKEKVYAEVAWNTSFEKFRVVKIVSSAIARSPTSRFSEVSKQRPEQAKVSPTDVPQDENE